MTQVDVPHVGYSWSTSCTLKHLALQSFDSIYSRNESCALNLISTFLFLISTFFLDKN